MCWNISMQQSTQLEKKPMMKSSENYKD